MSDETAPATGPVPIYVHPIPGGISLDMAALTERVVHDVLDALLGPDTTLWDQLHEVAELTPETAAAEAERGRLPYEELAAALAERSSSRVPLYGAAARLALIAKLRRASAAGRVPGQQNRRAS
ncbi:hypothetical protein ACFWA6_18245 [Streptomyces sp. NPDC060020]|uniref:hypothetical protein n=1 Tax=Streptomyces sp. NPDC060020 TaxID=3347038 RepID=UPI003682F7F2